MNQSQLPEGCAGPQTKLCLLEPERLHQQSSLDQLVINLLHMVILRSANHEGYETKGVQSHSQYA